jgi:pyruvate dehydrogenase E2 component (dihydrolipoamide acetyltransferase)
VTEFRLPSLGADMDQATILEWRVEPGDALVPGEVILVIDTEKSEMDVEALHPGVVTDIVVPVGATVPVGTVLARYDPPGTAVPTDDGQAPAEAEPAAPEPEPAPPSAPAPEPEPPLSPAPPPPTPSRVPVARVPVDAGRVPASPLARRLAHEQGIALDRLTGTGPGGAVTAHDVRAAPPPVAADGGGEGRSAGLRSAIASLMSRSKREIPHYYLDDDIDLGPALERLRLLNDDRPVNERLVPAVLLLRATALAARQHPELNGHLLDGRFATSDTVNLGMAVSLRGGGLVAPAILGAERLSVDELMAALKDLVGRARAGRLKPAELADATLTVTNLGDQGVRTVHPVIVPPQVAMVGFGKIADRPLVDGSQLRSSPQVTASLAADHRVSDGMAGARFLTRIARTLGDADLLFSEEEG